jgi:glycosyltransferase involved in cell wall biosynthesis
MGYKVTILALHSNYESLEEHEKCFVREGVQIRYVGQMHVRKVGNHKFYFKPLSLLWVAVRATMALLWAALCNPTDVYHVGKPQPMNGIAGMLAHWIRRKPLYLDCDDYEAASNTFDSTWQRRVVAFFEDWLPRFARVITVNTHFTKARLTALGYPPERIIYVPNGVDRERFTEDALESSEAFEALRQSLGLDGKRVVLYIGSMSLANHAVDLLLEAFAQVRAHDPHIVLLLVGGGEDLPTLQAQARALDLDAAVRFVGRVPPEQAPRYYRLAEVSIDPVYDEAAAAGRFPLKIVESWAAGVPVITGDVGERVALLAKGGGLLIPAGDVAALAAAILQLVSDTTARAVQAANARKLSTRYYWDQLATTWAAIYEPLMAKEDFE